MPITLNHVELARLIGSHLPNKETGTIEIKVTLLLRKRGVETKLILTLASGQKTEIDETMVSRIANAPTCWTQLKFQSVASINALAKTSHIPPSEVTRTLPLAFLAPDIMGAIVDGRQPVDLTTERLKRLSPFPTDWQEQRRILGFAP